MQILSNTCLVAALFSVAKVDSYEVVTDEDEGFSWRDYKSGFVHKDAYPAGRNKNGKPTYIGQVLHKELLIPAQIDPEKNKVSYEWGGRIFTTNKNTKIFCTKYPEQFEWLQTDRAHLINNLDRELIINGGYESCCDIFIGRKEFSDGEICVGKVLHSSDTTINNVSRDGKASVNYEFEILAYNPAKKIKIDEKDCTRQQFVINLYNM